MMPKAIKCGRSEPNRKCIFLLPKVSSPSQTDKIDGKVLSILLDQNDNYWFGTNSGAYFYNGKNLIVFNRTNGLFQNQLQEIQQDHTGNIWSAPVVMASIVSQAIAS